MLRRLAALGLAAAGFMSACGGGDSTAVTAPPATGTDTTAALVEQTVAQSVAAPDTTAAAVAAVDGPAFVDVADDALAIYAATVGQPATVELLSPALPGLTADLPLPAGLTVAGSGRIVELWDGMVDDEQVASFAEQFAAADLEAFGAGVSGGWTQASLATSGSLTTLLLTPAGNASRLSYVADADATASGSAPLELRFVPAESTMPEPAWLASLPHLDGGELTEVVEGVGTVTMYFGPADNGFVSARWRYPADALEALNSFLGSGVVEAAGFTYDKDLFNGFQNMVDVSAGEWTGTVLIGEAMIGDDVFYDLVWSLSRA